MNRRQFLTRAVGGTAVVAASVQSGWTLDTLRRLLASLFKKPIRYPSQTTVATLQDLFKKTQRELVEVLKLTTPEFDWMRNYGPVAGREQRIELNVSFSATGLS